MSRTVRVASTAGAFVAAGVAASLVSGRRRTQRRRRRGEEVPFGSVRGDAQTVRASDGVALHVEIDEADRRTPVVVLVHGWACTLDAWHYQRLALRGTRRLVSFDLRSHGRSGRSPRAGCTIEQLADDIRTVMAATIPRGPVVLVGHSMGGMAIMRLARDHPELFGSRVQGVVLINTSAGSLMRTPAIRYLVPLLRAASPLLTWGRAFNSYSVIRRWGLGRHAQERHVDMTNEMILSVPAHVLTDFYPAFVGLDLSPGLGALGGVRTVVIGGTEDQLTPLSHSRRLADAIDGATFVAIEGAGHMAMFEDHERVSALIEDLAEELA